MDIVSLLPPASQLFFCRAIMWQDDPADWGSFCLTLPMARSSDSRAHSFRFSLAGRSHSLHKSPSTVLLRILALSISPIVARSVRGTSLRSGPPGAIPPQVRTGGRVGDENLARAEARRNCAGLFPQKALWVGKRMFARNSLKRRWKTLACSVRLFESAGRLQGWRSGVAQET
jgi:hypothetical protein